MHIKTDQSIIASYMEDHSGLLGGKADRVAFPESEVDIINFLRQAAQDTTPVTIAGAGTGVTGGRVPFGGSVLSLERMNRILDITVDSDGSAVAIVQPGVSVDELKIAAAKKGLMYPPDPTERSAWIGGNVATNASGSRGYKYGPTRNYVKRLRVVLSSGEVLEIYRGMYIAQDYIFKLPSRTFQAPRYRLPKIKNAAGYFSAPDMDLIDLFIGQEGTLGVITEIEVQLLPLGQQCVAGIAFFENESASWRFVASARTAIAALSFEYFDRYSLALLREDYPHIPPRAQAAIFFEQDVDAAATDCAVPEWYTLLETNNAIMDAIWFSANAREQEIFREFRHALPEKVNQIVKQNRLPKVGTDIAVPPESFIDMMHAYHEAFEASGMQYLIFGHIGECHLHANILPKTQEEFTASRALYLQLVTRAVQLGGTVSAEHGIGKLKHLFLEAMIGTAGMKEIARVKKIFDPACILGLDTIIPSALLK
ncbi:MAG: FAD-binding oxidoreductase [Elusimicrobia bacterium]|nr:FAD-binding oxidoreductase [Elusimicrobiota bacterium]